MGRIMRPGDVHETRGDSLVYEARLELNEICQLIYFG